MADDQVKVKFLRDEIHETEGRNQGKQFKAGRVYSMTVDQAGRWIRRDAAELVEDEADEEDGPPKPRRGRPPKAKTEEAGDDESDEDEEPAAPTPPKEPPAKPLEPSPAAKPAETSFSPGPKHVGPVLQQQPAKAPDKGR